MPKVCRGFIFLGGIFYIYYIAVFEFMRKGILKITEIYQNACVKKSIHNLIKTLKYTENNLVKMRKNFEKNTIRSL